MAGAGLELMNSRVPVSRLRAGIGRHTTKPDRLFPTRCGHARTLSEALTGQKRVPGFVVYLCSGKERDLALKPLIWLCFWIEMNNSWSSAQLMEQALLLTLR